VSRGLLHRPSSIVCSTNHWGQWRGWKSRDAEMKFLMWWTLNLAWISAWTYDTRTSLTAIFHNCLFFFYGYWSTILPGRMPLWSQKGLLFTGVHPLGRDVTLFRSHSTKIAWNWRSFCASVSLMFLCSLADIQHFITFIWLLAPCGSGGC